MSLVHSIEGVFGWLLERSWQAALLAILIVVMQRALGAALSAKWRYGLWLVLVGLLLLPSLPESSFSIYNILPKARAASGPVGPLIALPIRESMVPESISSGSVNSISPQGGSFEAGGSLSVMQWLAMTWACIAIGLTGLLLTINIRFGWRLRSLAGSVDPRLHEVFWACKEELGICHGVSLVETPAVTSPAVAGIFRPILLVPAGFARSLEWEEVRYVFLHELGHLRRGDVRMNALLAFLQALHWFNPLLHWAFRRMRADRELACDAWVLSRLGAREGSNYGETLLKLMHRVQPGRRAIGLVGILENKRDLKTRIERIAGFSGMSREWPFAGAAIVFGLSLFFLTGARSPDSSTLEVVPPAKDPTVGRVCDRHGVVLVEYRIDHTGGKVRNRPSNYPLGAFAVQLLEGLDESVRPKAGETVRLTIDARIQMIVEEELRKVHRGAAVVLDPNNGDILAMASVPSFDPNQLYPAIEAADWKRLINDPTSPMMNRALNAEVPGAVFLPVTALAGTTAGLENRKFECAGSMPIGDFTFKCWSRNGHGLQDLPNALKTSCNIFFFKYGIATGGKIQEMAYELGLGKTSGVPVRAEGTGLVSGPEYLKKVNPRESWRDGHTANIAIGQGAMLVTPLQIAGMMEAIGNGGTLYWPRLIKSISRFEDRPLEQPAARIRTNLLSVGVPQSGLGLVRSGLWKTVNEQGGTARKAAVRGGEVAGATGISQVWRVEGDQKIKDSNTWFAGFAPFREPRYAFAILVQGAKAGGTVPAALAAKMLRKIEALRGPFVSKKLGPAKGSFVSIETTPE